MDAPNDFAVLPVGRLVSVQVGVPRKLTTLQGRTWESAITKEAISGPATVGKENLTGDRQANRKYHGGPDKAVCGYSIERYRVWQEEFGLELPGGAFGENITVAGLTEDLLCLGDVLAIGQVRLQVSQPRMPCVNVARRWNQRELPERMQATGFTGFYCRVLQTGEIQAGAEITITERLFPEWMIMRMNQTLYPENVPREEIETLRSIPILTGEWRRALGRKLNKMGESLQND